MSWPPMQLANMFMLHPKTSETMLHLECYVYWNISHLKPARSENKVLPSLHNSSSKIAMAWLHFQDIMKSPLKPPFLYTWTLDKEAFFFFIPHGHEKKVLLCLTSTQQLCHILVVTHSHNRPYAKRSVNVEKNHCAKQTAEWRMTLVNRCGPRTKIHERRCLDVAPYRQAGMKTSCGCLFITSSTRHLYNFCK